MGRWLIELGGEKFDLDEYINWFPNGDFFVFKENETYFLAGILFESQTDPQEVTQTAEQLVAETYCIIRLLQANLMIPSVSKIYREDDNGERQGFAFGACNIRCRSNVSASLTVVGAVSNGPTQAQDLLEKSRTNCHLSVAASLLAIPNASWPHLYRCLEEIEGFLKVNVDKAGYCCARERTRFTHTANTAEVSGINSRHGQGQFDIPKNPMSFPEANQFITSLLTKALNSVALRP